MSEPASESAAIDSIVAITTRWVERAVIGLNLCPFAKAVHAKGQIRYVVCPAITAEALLTALMDELQLLATTNPDDIETTLLIHPYALTDFLDFNDFLDTADVTIAALKLEGAIQIASFHPQYQFAGTDTDDISNFTNRSPYPTLHLLREASVTRAVAAFPNAGDIFEKNIATMTTLGHAGWERLR